MPSLPEEIVVVQGSPTVAYGVDGRGKRQVESFLNEQVRNRKAEVAKLFRYFEWTAAGIQIRNKQQFKKLEGHDYLHEFKGHQIRVLAFRHEDVWYLLYALIKKKDELPQGDIEKAENLRDQHLEWMRQEKLI